MRVLFVDPEFGGKECVEEGPELSGEYRMFTQVSSAEEALERCLDGSFDVVVAAHRLPGQSGTELLRTLKHVAPAAIRFLMIDEDEVTHFRSLVSDAQQIMLKPLRAAPFNRQLERALALRAVVRDPMILKFLGDADSLPPLPRIFRMICQTLNDPSSSLSKISEVIAEDIVLSSKVLKLANSALFGLQEPAGNIEQAVVRLGLITISSLVFCQEMVDSVAGHKEEEQFAEELNRHSIEVALLATKIAQAWNAPQQLVDQLFFCGIVHDLGKFLFATHAKDAWQRVQQEVDHNIESDVEIERMIFGSSHCELAAYLLAVWGLPDNQVEAILYHHKPSALLGSDSESMLVRILHLAENLCETHLHGAWLDWEYLYDIGMNEDDILSLMALA
jgi:HD-like signal output (HDOD) protein